MTPASILADERIASIRDVQKNPSQALRGITRVTRGSKTIGFFLSNEDFTELVESQQALMSPLFMKQIMKARGDAKRGSGKALASLAKEYGL